MSRFRTCLSRIDPGWLVALVIALLVVWPFISRGSLPVGTDAELHVFRLHELGQLVGGGEFYPRWAPNFYHGYGYPIFNYYAPLTYYLGLLVERWPAFDAVDGVKFVFVLGLLAAALGMYGFVRDNWGRGAGYVATAVYLYAPYVQYIDPHARGVLAESFSLGVFPLALWALDRLRRGVAGGLGFVTAVLLTAAVILSHNLMALLFFGVLAAWAVWHLAGAVWEKKRGEGTAVSAHSLKTVFAALFLGVGAAAIFWLPVLVERNEVNLNTLLGQDDNYDFRTHFLSVWEVLAFSQRLDWGASEPAFRFNLGVVQWVLGGLGLVMALLRRVKHVFHAVFFILVLLALLFLMLPVSAFVWDNLPFLPFFQFPWRMLGPAAAMLAALAGVGTAGLTDSLTLRGQRLWWLPALFVGTAILLGLPLSQPAPRDDFGEVNNLRMTLIENSGRWLGTTSTADYVPATVDTLPTRKGSVVAPIAEGKPPDRVNYATLPEGAAVETEVIRPLLTRYFVSAPQNMRLRLFLFDFPGWQVRVDGQPVETELGRPEGFIVVPLPAGEHVVEVEFGSTPDRTLALWISLLSLLLALVGGIKISRSQLDNQPIPPPQPLARADRGVLAVAGGITAVAILLLNPLGWLHDNSTGFTAVPAQQDLFADFGEQIALIGYTASTDTAVPGETIEVTLYWKKQDVIDINFQSFVHVLNSEGVLLTQSNHLNPGEYPTRQWPYDKYVRDVHTLTIPENAPQGRYTVTAGLWVQTEGWRMPVLDKSGQQIGDTVTLFDLTVDE
ncbi:MAG TPA: hypothetical protein EYP41_17605 [Anaerolineae bacterium]|nr:hypothetical protein [Anaerolineae bacterium]